MLISRIIRGKPLPSISLGINLYPLIFLSRRRDGLDLNLWQRCRLAAKICLLCVRVLSVVIRDGGFDGVLSKHGAVHYKQSVSIFHVIQVTLVCSRLTGGKQSSFAISVFLILAASSSVMPRTNSVR
jgi:hypothetical protein